MTCFKWMFLEFWHFKSKVAWWWKNLISPHYLLFLFYLTAPHQVLPYIGGATSSNSGVSLVYSMPSRNVSLRLQGLQEKDSGSYLCSVNVQDSQGTDRGHSTNTLELNVLGKWEASMGGKCLRGKVGGGGRGSVCGSGEGLPLVPWMWVFNLSPFPQCLQLLHPATSRVCPVWGPMWPWAASPQGVSPLPSTSGCGHPHPPRCSLHQF